MAQTATQTLELTVNPAGILEVTTTALDPASENSSYSATLDSSGGTSPIYWQMTTGSLPPGLSLDQSGDLSGTPTSPGIYQFGVEATDDSAVPVTATANLSLEVDPALVSLTPTTTDVTVGNSSVVVGAEVNYSAVVSPEEATGLITFSTGSITLCTTALSSGSASCAATNAPVGLNQVVGTYSGDFTYHRRQDPPPIRDSTAVSASVPTPPATAGHLPLHRLPRLLAGGL